MMVCLIDGVQAVVPKGMPMAEAAEYVRIFKERHPSLESIVITIAGEGWVDVEWHAKRQRFERIRRVTGYLAGTLDRFNDAKRAEVSDRVTHGVS